MMICSILLIFFKAILLLHRSRQDLLFSELDRKTTKQIKGILSTSGIQRVINLIKSCNPWQKAKSLNI
ncbi:hypothetical protein DHD80_07095 [Gramella sp. AN32]|nr:hypothetical protein [Gramella sp. AN32]